VRRGHDQAASPFQDRHHPVNGPEVILDVLEDLGTDDTSKYPFLEGQSRCIGRDVGACFLLFFSGTAAPKRKAP